MYVLTGEHLRLGLEVLRNMLVRSDLGRRGDGSTDTTNNGTKSERSV
jgi:hypothetical protein